jgi:hypothetical protein
MEQKLRLPRAYMPHRSVKSSRPGVWNGTISRFVNIRVGSHAGSTLSPRSACISSFNWRSPLHTTISVARIGGCVRKSSHRFQLRMGTARPNAGAKSHLQWQRVSLIMSGRLMNYSASMSRHDPNGKFSEKVTCPLQGHYLFSDIPRLLSGFPCWHASTHSEHIPVAWLKAASQSHGLSASKSSFDPFLWFPLPLALWLVEVSTLCGRFLIQVYLVFPKALPHLGLTAKRGLFSGIFF